MPHIKKTITEAIGLPKEVVLNLPLVTILGRGELTIENHKCILWADSEEVKIKTSCGVLVIKGSGLSLRQIDSDFVKLEGALEKLEFLI